MGASGWHYFVPFDADVSRALGKLRADVFARGDYHSPSKKAKKAKSIDELLEACADSGTHSVLDVARVATTPHPQSMNTWFQSFGGRAPTPEERSAFMTSLAACIGTVAPAPAAALAKACGSDKPDHAAMEAAIFGLFETFPRGCAIWATVFDRTGAPAELLFLGKTGD